MDNELAANEMISVGAPSRSLDRAAKSELAKALATLTSGGGLVFRLADLAGGVLGRGLRASARTAATMPGLAQSIQVVTEVALKRALDIAIVGLTSPAEQQRSQRLARPMVAISGAIGGFIGLSGFIPDVAVTSLTIMREIGRIAQESGEDLADPESRAACLQVFGFNGARPGQSHPDTTYFSTRLMMQGRPLAFLFREVASRYGLNLSQKLAVQAMPVVGAIGGAAINAAFLSHYRELADAHFTIRRLERIYGEEAVRTAATQPS